MLGVGALFWALTGCSDGVGRPLFAAEGGSAGVGGTGAFGGDTAGSSGENSNGGTEASLGGSGSDSTGIFGGKGSRFSGQEGGGENGNFGKPGGFPSTEWGREVPGIPDNAHCASVSGWPREAVDAELDFFDFVNLLRVQGKRCNDQETAASIPPLEAKPELWCAARLHSHEMATQGYESHVNQAGEDAAVRIERAGYEADSVGEAIAKYDASDVRRPEGRLSAFDIVLNLVQARQGDCETLLDPRFDAIGVGYHDGYWTIDLATTAQP